VDGQEFIDSFRILSLNSYDGIVGHDWLAKQNPMITHWLQQSLAIVREDRMIVLQGEGAPEITHAFLELLLVQDSVSPSTPTQDSTVQEILNEFSSVFATPVVLPPRR
jgi:hypothetical protein